MEKLVITYKDLNLTIQGHIVESDESVGIFHDTFEAEEIKHNDLDVFDDYDLDQLDEIEELCLKALKENNQTNWEQTNV